MKVAIIDGIAAHYRLSLFQKLAQQTDPEFILFASRKSINGIVIINPEIADLPVSEGGIKWKFIENIVILNRIIWQKDIINITSKGDFDIYIFIGEFHNLSTWIGVAICKIRRKKIAFWGHGSYGNEIFLKKVIRRIFNKLPDGYLLYNNRAKDLLIEENIRPEKLFVLNNSLNFDLHCKIRTSINSEEIISLRKKLFPLNDELPVVIFIGRLTREKKIDQLIESIDLLQQMGKKVNCLIIGTGQQENLLKNLVVSLKLHEYVNFYGPCYNESENGLLISMSECCISPGNVGLTAIHSMSFGTPVITHNDFSNQGPEASSIVENSTGGFFEKNNINSLTDKIAELVFKKGKKFYTDNCLKIVEDYYNPYYQLNIFNNLIQFLTSPKSDKLHHPEKNGES